MPLNKSKYNSQMGDGQLVRTVAGIPIVTFNVREKVHG
jgi:hypothetical protein